MIDFFNLYFDETKTNSLLFTADDESIKDIIIYQYVYVYLQNDEKTQLTYEWFSTLSESLIEILQEAIDNKLQLDPSIQYDLGYEYAQLFYNIFDDDLNAHNNYSSWKG